MRHDSLESCCDEFNSNIHSLKFLLLVCYTSNSEHHVSACSLQLSRLCTVHSFLRYFSGNVVLSWIGSDTLEIPKSFITSSSHLHIVLNKISNQFIVCDLSLNSCSHDTQQKQGIIFSAPKMTGYILYDWFMPLILRKVQHYAWLIQCLTNLATDSVICCHSGIKVWKKKKKRKYFL